MLVVQSPCSILVRHVYFRPFVRVLKNAPPPQLSMPPVEQWEMALNVPRLYSYEEYILHSSGGGVCT